MRQIHGQTIQREQMQTRNKAQRINMERCTKLGLCSIVWWWRYGCPFIHN